MNALNILESDLIEKFQTGGGSGGQKINKTASCVYIKHIPSGIEVKCQKTRSRTDNRFFARRILVEKIESILLGKGSSQQKKYDKIRKQKKRSVRRSKNRTESL